MTCMRILRTCSTGLLVALLGASPVCLAEDLTVSAAASLSNAFGDIAQAFEAAHPGAKVTLNFAASDVLLKQIEQGAPADVFASADEATMDRAAAGHHIDGASRADFAGNTLVLIVPAAASAPTTLAALQTSAITHIAIGNPASVPAGRYAQSALEAQQLWQPLQTKLVLAQNVRQALDYVSRAEADVGFVYATDAATQAGKVKVALTVPTATAVRYPAAVIAGSPHATLARDFLRTLQAPLAQATLAHYGFSAPN